ncbi:MAG: hemolysin family protein [Bryobacteraceae bacterium]|nr:hemolysin family protein [Bryobacteraceae bacterium]
MNEGHIGYRLILLALILAANGFFAASETALLSTRKSRLRQQAEAGNVGAQAALNLLANPERLLSVVQIGVTLASLGLGWAGEETIFNLLFGAVSPLLNESTAGILHGVVFTLSFALMTFGHVVLGEVVPKNLAIEKADRLAILVAPVLLIFYRITGPFVYAIERTSTGISRLIGLSGEAHTGGHSAEELKYIIASSRRELEVFEREALSRVLELGNYNAREVMVPRTAIVSVSVDASLDQVLRLFLEHLYSRMPVYETKRENIIGILHFKDLIRVWEERRAALERHRPVRPFRIRRILRKPLVVPETKPVNQLIADFRTSHTHVAMVVDEFGTITGLVTLEDALEQVFGEFEDEHDDGRAGPPRSESDVLDLDGTTPIRDLETQYGIELPGDAGFETLAGFLMFQAGEIPRTGEFIDYGIWRFTILEMSRHRIAKVGITRLPVKPSENETDSGITGSTK